MVSSISNIANKSCDCARLNCSMMIAAVMAEPFKKLDFARSKNGPAGQFWADAAKAFMGLLLKRAYSMLGRMIAS